MHPAANQSRHLLPCRFYLLGKGKRKGRWGSLTWEGSPSRGRKTLTSNLRCLAAYPVTGKASGVNPEEKSGVEPLRRLVVNFDFFPAAPAAKLVPDVLLRSPLDHTSEAERGTLVSGQP